MPNVIEITDFSAPELDVYARLTENQLINRAEPEKGLFIAESPNVILRALDAGYEPVSLLMEHKHVDGQAKEVISRCGGVPVCGDGGRLLQVGLRGKDGDARWSRLRRQGRRGGGRARGRPRG
ncbi:MAG: hypothetical protein MJ118_07930, partial [Clostridia bacterium]|nr:hypothetical protein [Clostridia bacterium]